MFSIPKRSLALLVPLTLGLFAGSVASPSITHAQIAPASLSAHDRALFVPALRPTARCNADMETVTADLQQVLDNLSAGADELGRLRGDALVMRNDCLSAAGRVNRLRFPAGASHGLARRVQSEWHAALVDFAQGAYQCARSVDDLEAGDGTAAVGALRAGNAAWSAASAHLRVATSYVR